MSILKSLYKANQVIASHAHHLGVAVSPPQKEVQATLEKYEAAQGQDSFYLYFDLATNRFKRVGRNIKNVLGISSINLEGWLRLIHPDFIDIYIEFGFSAYQASLKFRDEIQLSTSSYSINLPVQRLVGSGSPEYWLVKQTSYPLEFDAQHNMVSHINTYTLIGRFEQYAPMRPFVLFNHENQYLVEDEITKMTQKNVLNFFYRHLAERYKIVLLIYWQEYSKYKSGLIPAPSSSSIAAVVNKRQQTIQDYNKVILEASRQAFPLTEFSDMRSVAAFLLALFGPAGEVSDHSIPS